MYLLFSSYKWDVCLLCSIYSWVLNFIGYRSWCLLDLQVAAVVIIVARATKKHSSLVHRERAQGAVFLRYIYIYIKFQTEEYICIWLLIRIHTPMIFKMQDICLVEWLRENIVAFNFICFYVAVVFYYLKTSVIFLNEFFVWIFSVMFRILALSYFSIF